MVCRDNDKIDSLSTDYRLPIHHLDTMLTLVIKTGEMRYMGAFTPRH